MKPDLQLWRRILVLDVVGRHCRPFFSGRWKEIRVIRPEQSSAA
jgi:hypothetical protein